MITVRPMYGDVEPLARAAKTRGYSRVGLAVGAANAGAQRLYARAGYCDTGLREFWIEGAHEICGYLAKEL